MKCVRWVVLLLALSTLPAFAKAPAGQGRKCKAGDQCESLLRCVKGGSGSSSCELVCQDNKGCPEDQRCVADGAQKVCRAIQDGVGL
jgi:hypothetical protein